ncbi:MAG: sugar ABC transporter ATP-binding protein, partial [Clostridia bacterium]|nr:sugar ABC transporter ATP-binding protein [Clostridia bacterium]
MKDGVIQQADTPQNLYNFPCNMFVAGFIGSPQMNFLSAKLKKRDSGVFLQLAENELDITDKFEDINAADAYDGQNIKVGVRPEDFVTKNLESAQYKGKILNVKIEVSELMGNETNLYFDYDGEKIIASVPAEEADDNITEIAVKTDKIHLFDPNSTARII